MNAGPPNKGSEKELFDEVRAVGTGTGFSRLNFSRRSRGMEDYYRILGVHHNSEDVVIRAAYTALMRKYHPDVYKGDRVYAERRCKEINQAYEVLSDSTARAAYDEKIKTKVNGNGSGGGGTPRGGEGASDHRPEPRKEHTVKMVKCGFCEAVLPRDDARMWSYDERVGHSSAQTTTGMSWRPEKGGPTDRNRRAWSSRSSGRIYYKRKNVLLCEHCLRTARRKRFFPVAVAIAFLCVIGIVQIISPSSPSSDAAYTRAARNSTQTRNVTRGSGSGELSSAPQAREPSLGDGDSGAKADPADQSPTQGAEGAVDQTAAVKPLEGSFQRWKPSKSLLTLKREGEEWRVSIESSSLPRDPRLGRSECHIQAKGRPKGNSLIATPVPFLDQTTAIYESDVPNMKSLDITIGDDSVIVNSPQFYAKCGSAHDMTGTYLLKQ